MQRKRAKFIIRAQIGFHSAKKQNKTKTKNKYKYKNKNRYTIGQGYTTKFLHGSNGQEVKALLR